MVAFSLPTRIFLTLALCMIIVSSPSTPGPVGVRAESGSFFHITLLVPTSNTARQAWATVVQNNLNSLGIDTSRVALPFSDIFSRALTPDLGVVGKTYDQGGFDALFIGYNMGIDPDPWSLYHSSQFAPYGGNYYLWNNTQNDELTTRIKETVDNGQRLELVKQWQALAADELPSITLLYTREIVAFDNTLSNAQAVFSAYHYPTWPPVEQLSTTGTNNSVILAQTGPAPSEGLIPILSTSYYDSTVWYPMFASLAQRNDTIFKNMIPQLASGVDSAPGWSVSSDNKTWTVHLRPGITWHDGVPFNATDVKFTFDAAQDDTLASYSESFIRGIVGGKNDVTALDPYTVRFSLPLPYSYFVQNILTTPILPAHILGRIPYADWRSSSFNTGLGGPGPVGAGPYKWVRYDPTTETIHLTRNDNYFDFPENGKTALQSRGRFQVKDFYVRHIAAPDAATAAISGHSVDVLDPQYHLETQPSFLSSWGADKLAVYDGFGVQELGVNMRHPIVGTGIDTPLGARDPSRAALAAKYVRQAISYAVPRQLIIDQFLNGYGNPGITTPVVGNARTGFAVTEGFNTDLRPYDFKLTRSRELLEAAGYFSDFAVSASPGSLTVSRGGSASSTILLTSQDGFTGTVNLTTSIFPSIRRGPVASLNMSIVSLSPGGGAAVLLTVSARRSASPGAYTITIMAKEGSTIHNLAVTVTVLAKH